MYEISEKKPLLALLPWPACSVERLSLAYKHILDVMNRILAEKSYQRSHCIWTCKMRFISCLVCQIFEHPSFLRLSTGIVRIFTSSGQLKWSTRFDGDSKAVLAAGYASAKLSYLQSKAYIALPHACRLIQTS